jgi:hypothetical protein
MIPRISSNNKRRQNMSIVNTNIRYSFWSWILSALICEPESRFDGIVGMFPCLLSLLHFFRLKLTSKTEFISRVLQWWWNFREDESEVKDWNVFSFHFMFTIFAFFNHTSLLLQFVCIDDSRKFNWKYFFSMLASFFNVRESSTTFTKK